ncbi:MAG: T9SS type A sorting domain-containing protein [Ferruginibacter sp.]|nr:T9SS type A sorting domain-containing protein [Ferruginibacter sp.]
MKYLLPTFCRFVNSLLLPSRKNKFYISLMLASVVFITGVSAQSYTWNNVAMGGGGYVSGLITSKKDPNVVYARTDVGGAYRWDQAGNRWVSLLDWVNIAQNGYNGVESIAIDPSNSANVYMFAGTIYTNNGVSAILKSTDNGASFSVVDVTNQFKAHGNGSGRGNGEKLQVDPNDGNILWCGTRQNGLFKSTDAGFTWNRNEALPIRTTKIYYGGIGTGISFVLLDSASGTAGNPTPKIYVGVATVDSASNLYVSNDGGLSFNPVPLAGGPDPGKVMPARATLAKNGSLYITYDSMPGPGSEIANSGAVWKYNTLTSVWTKITPSNGLAYGGISVDPQNPLRVIVSTVNTYKAQYVGPGGGIVYGDRFYISNDGGSTWTILVPFTGYNNNNITLDPNGIPWIAGQSIHWAGSIEFDPFNSNKAWVTSGNGVFVCDNLNSLPVNSVVNTWKFVAQGIEETVPNDMVSIPGGPFFSVISDYDGFKQTNVAVYSTTGRYSPATGTTNGIAYAALNTNKLVRVGGSMYYTTDQGVTWTKTSAVGGNGTNGKVALSANGSTILHCPTGTNSSNNTYRSVDNGSTWTIATGINFNGAVPVADPVNNNKFYTYNNNNGNLYRSSDGGLSFSESFFVGTGGSKLARTAPGYEGHLWIAMYNGGLKRMTNWGTVSTISGVTACSAVGLGKAAPAAAYFSIYIWGTVNGVTGIFRSTDEGLTWNRVNDDQHQYGGPGNGQFVMGDMNIYGRVYMSTVGRGIAYGSDNAVLPVSLVSFNVKADNGFASLNWNTATEINNLYFDVERSMDGASFDRIGAVLSKSVNGSSSSPLYYNFNDNIKSFSGVIYYRLKQVDKDGKFTYSAVLGVNTPLPNNEKVLVFPNPVNNKNINLKIQLKTIQNVQVRISNVLGAIVYMGSPVKLLAGTNVLNLDQPVNLSRGTYIVEVISLTNQLVIGTNKMVVR